MNRPQVVAHRGASHDNAEHTLGAYVAALDDGADGLECDVRLTADGHLVCVHDRDLRRTAASTAGRCWRITVAGAASRRRREARPAMRAATSGRAPKKGARNSWRSRPAGVSLKGRRWNNRTPSSCSSEAIWPLIAGCWMP